MRTIKFRFWDSFNGEYFYSDKYEKLSSFFTLYELSLSGDNKPILEQFTGLQDKNGVDIYEGDILFLQESPSSHHYIEYCSERCCFTDMRIEDGESNTDHYGFEFVKDCEVIGNEFNNPELLTK